MALQEENMPTTKPTIIGLYAISGSGKSHLLNNLKTDPALASFAFYDGSEVLDRDTPGGLTAFRQLAEDRKKLYREDALARNSKECQDANKTGVVAGHYMFWNPELSPKEKIVRIEKEWDTYTHIVYLNVDAELVARRRRDDALHARSDVAVEDLRAWQATERNALREKCRERSVLFTSVAEHASSISSVTLVRLKALLLNLQQENETPNAAAVGEALDPALGNHDGVGNGLAA